MASRASSAFICWAATALRSAEVTSAGQRAGANNEVFCRRHARNICSAASDQGSLTRSATAMFASITTGGIHPPPGVCVPRELHQPGRLRTPPPGGVSLPDLAQFLQHLQESSLFQAFLLLQIAFNQCAKEIGRSSSLPFGQNPQVVPFPFVQHYFSTNNPGHNVHLLISGLYISRQASAASQKSRSRISLRLAQSRWSQSVPLTSSPP